MRIRYFIFLFLVLCVQVQANPLCKSWEVEFRVAGFHPSSNRFHRIYQDWLVDYEGQFNAEICGPIAGWVNVGYSSTDGHSIFGHRDTNVRFIPISFGLKYDWYITRCIDLYGGVGAVITTIRTDDHDAFLREHINKWRWGGVVKLGAKWYFLRCLFLDVFGDYYYTPVRFTDERLLPDPVVITTQFEDNLGGWRVGGGIGYAF